MSAPFPSPHCFLLSINCSFFNAHQLHPVHFLDYTWCFHGLLWKLNYCPLQCDHGWYGTDCSVPSVLSTLREWPQWLRPAAIKLPTKMQLSGTLVNLNASVKKKRPLLYVYDLPPEFNSLLLEVGAFIFNFSYCCIQVSYFLLIIQLVLQGRHFKFQCVNRIYDDRNATLWTDMLYGSQVLLRLSIN